MKQIAELIGQNLNSGRSDHVALVAQNGTEWTYETLFEHVGRACFWLNEQDFQSGTRVALYAEKSFDFVVWLFACAARGLVFVPVNPKLKADQIDYILKHSGAVAIHARDAVLKRTGMAERMAPATLRLPDIANLPDQTLDPTPLHPPVIDQDMVAILYTSGSTGQPKGVMISHRNLISGAECVGSYLRYTPDDRVLCVLSFSFDAGLSQIFSSFWAGSSAVLLDFALPDQVRNIVRDKKITAITAIPTLWRQILGAAWVAEDVSTVTKLANTGGHLDVGLQDQLEDRFGTDRIYCMYGLTEAFRSTYLDPDLRISHPESIGCAVPNAEILLIKEDGTEAGIGEPGELVHRGAHVALGYWNDPEKTAAVYRPIPRPREFPREEIAVWSGDWVTRDDNGLFYFVGRKDGMIKRSGYRISATEVETGIAQVVKGTECVVFGRKDAARDHEICAIFQMSALSKEDWAEILKDLRKILPQHMIPSAATVFSEFPLTANGKVDRTKLVAAVENNDWLE